MPQKRRPPRPVRRIDPAALAEFQAGIRKRYSDEEILEQLRASAKRLGRSPTMREFEDDPEATVHPQTVIQHFKSWNEAKRKAGLVPRRFAEPADLIRLLRELGDELGRPPTAKDLDEHRASMPSKSLYWHMFGSLKNALREAGFDVPVGEERLERAIDQGVEVAVELGRLPKFAMKEGGAETRPDGRVADLPHARGAQGRLGRVPVPRARAAARGRDGGVAGRGGQRAAAITARRRRQVAPSCGARTAGRAPSSKAPSGMKRVACLTPSGHERNEDALGKLTLAELQFR